REHHRQSEPSHNATWGSNCVLDDRADRQSKRIHHRRCKNREPDEPPAEGAAGGVGTGLPEVLGTPTVLSETEASDDQRPENDDPEERHTEREVQILDIRHGSDPESGHQREPRGGGDRLDAIRALPGRGAVHGRGTPAPRPLHRASDREQQQEADDDGTHHGGGWPGPDAVVEKLRPGREPSSTLSESDGCGETEYQRDDEDPASQTTTSRQLGEQVIPDFE